LPLGCILPPIIGPSGTGKSTFLRCLNLLDRPSSGSIHIDGVDILNTKADVPKIRQKMNMVFQSFNLFSHLTSMENLTIGQTRLLGMSKKDAKRKSHELLKLVGLAGKADSYPDELSGGQKQRVAIARCRAMNPEIILVSCHPDQIRGDREDLNLLHIFFSGELWKR